MQMPYGRVAPGSVSLGGNIHPGYPVDGRLRLARHLAQPFAPDGDEQRHQYRTDEETEKSHRLDAADQAEKRRQEGQLDRAADEPRPQCLVYDEELRRTQVKSAMPWTGEPLATR